MDTGFFAFAHHDPERTVASWFLAAQKGHYIVDQWRKRTASFWYDRAKSETYYWFHRLFTQAVQGDPEFSRLWDGVPKHAAIHSLCFGPGETLAVEPLTREQLADLENPPSPVFKLSHRHTLPLQSGASGDVLCKFARGEHPASPPSLSGMPRTHRVLVAWYGSIVGHGTIGDLRSMEALVSHLVGRGHEVLHASATDTEIPGARRVQWDTVPLSDFDVFTFVCGPLMRGHQETEALFDRFRQKQSIAIGVSPIDDFDAGFTTTLAREGSAKSYGDIAIAAPPPTRFLPQKTNSCVVGLALRGWQTEYGDRCLSDAADRLAMQAAEEIGRTYGGFKVAIENRLRLSPLNPDGIEAAYADCDLVITTRFHGAVCALRAGVPFIAIDQIAGGAKVSNLLGGLGWPHVYRADRTTAGEIAAAALALMESPNFEPLHHARQTAVHSAKATLSVVDDWLEKTPASPKAATRRTKDFLFVCGCPRSGTSATRHFLANSRHIIIGSERFAQRVSNLHPALFEKERFYTQEHGDCGYDIKTAVFPHHDAAAYFRDSIEWFDDARLIGDKIPYLYKELPQLADRFPNARVLITLRDVYEVAQSYKRRSQDQNDHSWKGGLDDAIDDWNDLCVKLTNVPSSLRILLLPYHRFFIEGQGLDELFAFLGLQDEALVEAHKRHIELARRLRAERPLDLTQKEIDKIASRANFAAFERRISPP